MTSGSLWNHYRDEINDFDDNAWDSKSIEYKAKIVTNTLERPGNEGDTNQPPVPILNVEVTNPHKYLIAFWRSLMICHW